MSDESRGVDLPKAGRSASAAIQRILETAVSSFPQLAGALDGFDDRPRRSLGEALVRFESLRSALPAPQRVDAATVLLKAAADSFIYADADGSETPLAEYLLESASALPLETHAFGAGEGMHPRIPRGASTCEGSDIVRLADALSAGHEVTTPVVDALSWIARQKTIDLVGEKFVVLGAAAEIAPTAWLLEAGATVFFVDLHNAMTWAAQSQVHSGTLVFATGGADVLSQPREIAASITAFAGGDSVHVAAFAYRGGNNYEWRLAAAMNAILRSLDPAIVRSYSAAVSPTAPATAAAADAAAARNRLRQPSLGDRFWRAIGVATPSLIEEQGVEWPRTVVALQGSSYVAAQYFEKRLAAEVYGTRGLRPERRQPILVSANVTGITRTASMNVPIFRAALLGALDLGVHSYAPETTRALWALLYVENLRNPRSIAVVQPADDENVRAERIHATQVHGGLFAYPYAIDPTMIRAAAIGLMHQPQWVFGLLRSLIRAG